MNEMKLRKNDGMEEIGQQAKGDVMQQMVDDNRGMEDWATKTEEIRDKDQADPGARGGM